MSQLNVRWVHNAKGKKCMCIHACTVCVCTLPSKVIFMQIGSVVARTECSLLHYFSIIDMWLHVLHTRILKCVFVIV